MTDSEYIDLTDKLKSFTDASADLRDTWSGKKKEDLIRSGVKITILPDDETIILPDGSMILPKGIVKMRLSNAIQRTVKLMDGCKDYSSYHLSSTLYKTMDDFVSATSDLPEDLMKIFVPVQARCREIMNVLKPSRKAMTRADEKKRAVEDFRRSLLASQAFADAKEAKMIDDQMNWKGKGLDSLVLWLVCHVTIPMIGDDYSWKEVDGIFVFKGKPVTARMLTNCAYRIGLKDTIDRPVSPSIN